MPRRFVGRTRGKTIDFKQWSSLPSIQLQLGAAASVFGSSLTFAVPGTILRVRGDILCMLDGVGEGVAEVLNIGLALLAADSVITGAPDPGGEPEFPWLWWTSIQLIAQTTGPGSTAEGSVGQAGMAESSTA